MGRPIFASCDHSGTTYIFDRIADCDAEEIFVQDLKESEIFIQPGLIYRKTA